MQQYLDVCRKAVEFGLRKKNRTDYDHIGYHGDMMKFDLADGFPAVTTKKLNIERPIGEMLGFLRGYTNAAEFRALGCTVWDANANENKAWLNNPHRIGIDDLGPIYGHPARKFGAKWISTGDNAYVGHWDGGVDQLHKVYTDLKAGIDDRREIVTHWNPSDLHKMALPPCHLLYQFGIQGEYLNLSMYQRSCDLPLGVPFNIAGYAWLLSVMAHITDHKVGVFTHFMHDIHIYENQMELMKIQLTRKPLELPTLWINPKIKTLEDLETWVTPTDFHLEGYDHHPFIKYPFAV